MAELQPDYVDIELTKPAEIAGARVKILRMREPTVADQLVFEAMKGSDLERDYRYFANLCEVSPDDLKRLPLRDYKRVQKAFLDFLD